jgi:maltokinase
MAPNADALARLAEDYLSHQSWFTTAIVAEPPARLELVDTDHLREGPPGLSRLIFRRGAQHFQLLLGWRGSGEVGALRNEENTILGAVRAGDDQVVVYDALADDELCRSLLELATDGAAHAARVRPVASLVSHASLVFDERIFMKVYRVLEPGSRPEIEVLFGLQGVGFTAMLAPLGRWRDSGFDLALARQFLPSALEARPLALTSLRDVLAQAGGGGEADYTSAGHLDPDETVAAAGGDFAGEMARLGGMTGRLHLALAAAFGEDEISVEHLLERLGATTAAAQLAAQLSRSDPGSFGQSLRLHGDYHLRRVMRSELGWIVTGIADDPLLVAIPGGPSLPGRRGSALEDLADMSFALGQLVREALANRPAEEAEAAATLALAWWRRNRRAFLTAYLAVDGVLALLPENDEVRDLLLRGFEAERERRYEATSAEG